MTATIPEHELVHGDAVEVLRTLGDGTVDALITDPPYPEIDRAYGRLSVDEWFVLMRAVVAETRRVLKPSGSAVFILQPNSEKIGRMRSWVFDFQSWICREWNMVQDVYWWNWAAMPLAGTKRDVGLLRGSLKACVWAGAPDCYRNQDAVLWEPSDSVKALTRENRAFRVYNAPDGKTIDKQKIMRASVERGGVVPYNVIPCREEHPGLSGERVTRPSSVSINAKKMQTVCEERGGVTPYNVIPCANTDSSRSAGAAGHPAGTPAKLCAWWVKYISPPGGLVVDPFSGSGTVPIEAVKLGREAIGIEAQGEYHQIARARMHEISCTPREHSPLAGTCAKCGEPVLPPKIQVSASADSV